MDEDELEEELEDLQQEVLDEKMLKSGTVPVADSVSVQRLPNVSNTEGEWNFLHIPVTPLVW